MKHRIGLALLTIWAIATVATPVAARLILVPDDEQTIQDGVRAAQDGDTVLVAPGRYRETVTFAGNEIVLASQYLTTGDEALIAETIIDGSGGNGRSVVAIRDAEGEGSELAGFTIVGGNTDYGGGVYCTSTRPQLHHLIIENNSTTDNGGGLYCTQGAEVTLRNSIIRNNRSSTGGGGVTCYFSARTTLENVTVTGNNTGSYGGGVQCSQSAEIVLRNCTVSDNVSGGMGGGCFSYNNAVMTLENCVVSGNTSGTGAAFQNWSTDLFIDHTLVTGNNSNGDGEAIYTSSGANNILSLLNATIVDNDNGSSLIYWAGGSFLTSNTIIWQNGEQNPRLTLDGGRCVVAYSDIVNGEELFNGAGGLEWGEGNFNEDPGFDDRENGDYNLAPQSPCIDTGDPDGTPDPDGTRADVGALYYRGRVVIQGNVLDAATGEPLSEANLTLENGVRVVTNEEGYYQFTRLRTGEHTITVRRSAYNDSTLAGIGGEDGDTLTVDFGLLHPEIVASIDRIDEHLRPGDSTSVQLTLRNPGNGWLHWASSWSDFGERAAEPYAIRRSIPASVITGSTRLYGAVFTGEEFIVVGEDANDSNMVYVMSREGELLRQFPQPTTSRRGMKDLEWDGELIWGSGETTIYGMTPDGEVVRRFEGADNPTTNIAYDAEHDLFWVSGITTNISAFDHDGNALGQVLQSRSLRKYGLAYWPDDPDGYPLYVISNYAQDQKNVFKINPANGDTIRVHSIETATVTSLYTSSSITFDYDPIGPVMVCLDSDAENDFVQIVQMQQTPSWIRLEPGEGQIAAGGEQEILLSFNTVESDTDGYFYEAEVVIGHNALGERLVIPVSVDISVNEMAFELALDAGWNMISAPVEPDNPGVVEVLRPLVREGSLIFFKDGRGRFYHPAWNVNNIPRWDCGQGYLAKITAGTRLQIYGDLVDPTEPISLSNGWNMIAYLPEAPQEARDAFAGLGEKLTVAKDGSGRFYLPRYDYNSLPALHRGGGYQIKTTEDCEFVWAAPHDRLMSHAKEVSLKHFAAHLSTGNNMPLVIPSGSMTQGSELAVYTSSGVYCGAVALSGSAPWGGAIWGDDPTTTSIDGAIPGDLLVFKLWDGKQMSIVSPEFIEGAAIYESDGIAAIRFGEVTPSEFTLADPYPNPFNSTTTIQFTQSETAPVRLTVYDLSGREAVLLINNELKAGTHSIVWNASNLTAGVYIVKLETPSAKLVRKVALVK